MNPAVAKVFATYPPKLRQRLLAVRRMIFEVAKQTEGVGKLQETLKWGEPAYVTAETGSGSTIRINCHKRQDRQYAVYFHCADLSSGASAGMKAGILIAIAEYLVAV